MVIRYKKLQEYGVYVQISQAHQGRVWFFKRKERDITLLSMPFVKHDYFQCSLILFCFNRVL